MTPKQFSDLVQLSSRTETEKATLVAFFLLKRKEMASITHIALADEMVAFSLGRPNTARLRKNLLTSKAFLKGSGDGIRLSLKKIEQLEAKFPEVSAESEEVIADETILPEDLYKHTRGYLERVAKQINACYQHNLFDGCAMLMRRLIEMLIVLTYRQLKREDEIKDPKSKQYYPLSYLINYSETHKVLELSKESEAVLDAFRRLGNYSAHGLEYSCRKGDLSDMRIDFRACVEELLYRSGVKK